LEGVVVSVNRAECAAPQAKTCNWLPSVGQHALMSNCTADLSPECGCRANHRNENHAEGSMHTAH
jgi:hypothetical protein